ncbi:MAG: hypothetical protein U0R81_14815 [Mycobacterium sp.]
MARRVSMPATLLASGAFALTAAGLGIGGAPIASADQSCGPGYHLDSGSCTLDGIGPGARFVSGTSCWYGSNGSYSCPVGV